jgi:hypothetical protein
MAKKGISKIKGPEEIHLGETVYYEVSRIYDLNDREKVDFANWKIYVRDKGSFRELRQKPGTPSKKGYKIPLTINNQKLVGKEILIEAYLYETEKSAPPGLKVKIRPGKNKKIDRVELFMRDDTPIKENTVLKYGQGIKVKVYTQNMPGEKIKLSLYEDDVNGSGHSIKNEKNKVAGITRNLNKDGFLWHEFKLPVEFSKIANAVMDGNHDKIHEYYVVAETAQYKSVSKNAEVKNPDSIFSQTVSSSIDPNKIYPKEILIEEVVIKGKYKKQVGVDAMEKSGRSMVGVKSQPREKIVNNKNSKTCYCYLQGLTKISCNGKGSKITDEHYQNLAKDIGVEAKVFKTVAIVESGGRKSFINLNGLQKAKILYERHYMYRFLKKIKTEDELTKLKKTSPDLVHNVGTYKDPNAKYGSEIEQFDKLAKAKKINNNTAIKSCSWGKFQVMGKYYDNLYSSPNELEEAMNMCEVQHFAYFKVYLKDVTGAGMIKAMKEKNWNKIAELYNGPDYAKNKYHTKMKNEYNKL